MHFAQIETIPEVSRFAKVLVLAFLSFSITMILTPVWAHILYKYKIGIKIKKKSVDGKKLTYVGKLHKHKDGTPTMGGVLIWGSVMILAILMFNLAPILSEQFQNVWISRLNFFSRSQTLLPLFTLLVTALLGLVDDWMSIKSIGKNKGGGMQFAWRMGWLLGFAGLGAWWFYDKLEWTTIHIPAMGNVEIGWLYIPLFMFIVAATAFSSNETDGLDGLNAGILVQAFTVFSIIAFYQQRMDLAAFCGVVAGALLAFLWFNFYPARFFMGDTGAFSLGATLGVVALLLNSVLVLPFVVSIYVLETLSVFIQLLSKKFRHKKFFLAAPIHHHFEALGWPETKVTVRFWILNAVVAVIGLLIGVIGGG